MRMRVGCLVIAVLTSNLFAEPSAGPWKQPVKFGLVTYFSLRHKGTELGESIKPTAVDRTNYLDAIEELGITTIRDAVINWAEVQPERGGPYDFGYLDDLMRKSSQRGIEILALAYFFPPWATIGEDRPWSFPGDGRYQLPMRKYEADFRKFVHTAVERYCGCTPRSLSLQKPIKYLVFMNETEGYSGEFLSPDEYAHWLRVFSEEVKAVDPRLKIVAPALAAPGGWHNDYFRGEFLDRLLASPELQGPGWPYFDVVDFHPYPTAYASEPDLFAINVATSYVRSVMERHGLHMPLWITELGDDSPDQVVQADRLVEYAIHAATLGVERVYVFGMADYGKNHWGILEDTQSGVKPIRKASFVAYKTFLSEILDNERIDFLGPGRYRIFRRNKPIIYLLWAAGEHSPALYFLRGDLRVTDLTGKTQTIDAQHLKLGIHPIFVEPGR